METTGSIAKEIARSKIPTVLFLGAGASIPSGAPTGAMLSRILTQAFFPDEKERQLSDISGRVEIKFGRSKLVSVIRENISKITPSETLKQLPNFNFSNIFTTNYDELIEKSYQIQGVKLPVIKSNRDYSFDYRQYNTMLFKLHGCITEDRCDGLPHGMIITDEDYLTYGNFRHIGFKYFEQSLATSNVVFVGYSMQDSNIRDYVEKAIALCNKQECPGQAFLILYEEDEIESIRWQNRGLRVAYGDLDSLLNSLATTDTNTRAVSIFSPISHAQKHSIASEICSVNPEKEKTKAGNIRRLISGSELSYGDINDGNAFPRSCASEIVQQIMSSSSASIHLLLGPSGAGKTSAGRLALASLSSRGVICYEHKSNLPVDLATWRDIDQEHAKKQERACLFLDEPNASQFAVNNLASFLMDGSRHALSLIIAYHPSIWSYRTKSSSLIKNSIIHNMSSLTASDINYIANFIRRRPEVSALLSADIQRMSHQEIVGTIRKRANSDLFVSLKYLFETKSLDEIVLKEFDKLGKNKPEKIRTDIRSLYETVAFLEAVGRHVHRQMVLRVRTH